MSLPIQIPYTKVGSANIIKRMGTRCILQGTILNKVLKFSLVGKGLAPTLLG